MRVKNIQQQTLLLLLSLTFGLAIVFSLFAVITAFIVEDILLDKWLLMQVNYVESYFLTHGKIPEIPFDFIKIFSTFKSLPEWAHKTVAGYPFYGEIFTADNTHYHYRKLNVGSNNGYMLAEVSRLLVVTQQPQIFTIFLFIFFVFVLLASWLAVTFSQRIVKPIILLNDAVKGNKRGRKVLPKLPYELGFLANTLQESFDRLDTLLKQEKDFSTNVSHELRTPLTMLRNVSLLIGQRGLKEGDTVVIDSACQRMQNTIDVLFALARTRSIELEPCRIVEVLEQSILNCHPLLSGFGLQLNVKNKLQCMANRQLLDILFSNLLRNAAEHSGSTLLTIIEREDELIFENKIVRSSQDSSKCLPLEREMASGLGQGLYLINKIVERFGWDFIVEKNNDIFKARIKFTYFT